MPIFGTVTDNSNGDFTVDSQTQVTANFTGRIKVSVNIKLQSTVTRANANIRIKINSTPLGPIGASGYIRNSNSHTSSSLHICEAEFDVVSGQTIQLGSFDEAAAGIVTMNSAGNSSIRIQRIS